MRADTRARRVCPLEAAPHRLPSLLTNGSSISDAALGFEVRLVRPGTPSHSGKQKGRGRGGRTKPRQRQESMTKQSSPSASKEWRVLKGDDNVLCVSTNKLRCHTLSAKRATLSHMNISNSHAGPHVVVS